MHPLGTTPLLEVHSNTQNFKKFGGKKQKKHFKRNGSINGRNQRYLIEAKTLSRKNHNDNSQACQRCGCNPITKKCHTTKHLVDLYIKFSGKDKKVQGDKFEAHFNTQTTDVGCSKDVLAEHEVEKILPQLDNLNSTENMIVEFQSNDMFRNFN